MGQSISQPEYRTNTQMQYLSIWMKLSWRWDATNCWTWHDQHSQRKWDGRFSHNAECAIYSTYHTMLKALLSAAIFVRDRDILLIYPSQLTGRTKKNSGKTTKDFNTKFALNKITKLVTKFWFRKVDLSAKHKTSMKGIHGLANQFIQIKKSGFND